MKIELQDLKERLKKYFKTSQLELIDHSSLHRDHNKKSMSEITHLQIIIKSAWLEKKELSMIQKHRLIKNFVFKFFSQLHSISIKIL